MFSGTVLYMDLILSFGSLWKIQVAAIMDLVVELVFKMFMKVVLGAVVILVWWPLNGDLLIYLNLYREWSRA